MLERGIFDIGSSWKSKESCCTKIGKCYFCGLAYIDVARLKEDNICPSFDGNLWIKGKRERTGVRFNIPLLDMAKKILGKYKGQLPAGCLLSVLSNQKTNTYLKEIGDVCGIKKNITLS